MVRYRPRALRCYRRRRAAKRSGTVKQLLRAGLLPDHRTLRLALGKPPAVSALQRRRAAAPMARVDPIVLDSSCWIEFFADSDRADLFAPAIEAVERLVVPVITVYQVVRNQTRDAGDEVASVALSLMQRGRVVEVDLSLALEACTLGLPLAESLSYGTARRHGAMLWTQDGHFEGLDGVQSCRKHRRAGVSSPSVAKPAAMRAPAHPPGSAW